MDFRIDRCVFVFLLAIIVQHSSGQAIRAGFKAGPQLSWFKSDDRSFAKMGEGSPVVGFHAGAVVAFKVRDRFFLNTELIYSQKGKSVTGKVDPNLSDKVHYNHIDLPILFAWHFKGNVSDREFKWYVNAGPNVSYWLGGKGRIESGDLMENGVSELKYKIRFGTRPDNNSPDILYIKDANRLQFGLNAGGGILLEPGGNQKVLVDLRFEAGGTWLGTPQSSQFIVPSDFRDTLKGRNMGIRLSLAYMLEYSTAKKDVNKGKSATKRKF